MRSNPNMYGINVACLEGVKPFELENVVSIALFFSALISVQDIELIAGD